jgi:hypothetical protein
MAVSVAGDCGSCGDCERAVAMECSTVPGTGSDCCSSAGEAGRERPRHQRAEDGVLGEVEASMVPATGKKWKE